MGTFHKIRGYHKVSHAIVFDALLIETFVSSEMIL